MAKTGKSVPPGLYVAFGASSFAPLCGYSKLILAVNINTYAPVARLADYTIVADFAKCMLRLSALLTVVLVDKNGDFC